MKTFAFYTKDGFRQDVKATTARGAWNKIQSLPGFRERFNGSYGEYDKDGLLETGTISGRIEGVK